jgi:hypothetical protein
VNQFRLKKIDISKKVYQYDVCHTASSFLTCQVSHPEQVAVSGPCKDPKVMVKKLWEHPKVQTAVKAYNGLWLYDGNKLAW